MTGIKLSVLLSFVFLNVVCSKHEIDPNLTSNENAMNFLNEIISDSDSPAMQYMIVSPDSTLFEYNYGLADVKNKKPITADATLNAFSVTKTFTALAILQLEEQGKLNINDTIAKYLDYYPYGSSITIKQVLNHTSGLPNPLPLKWVHLLSEDAGFNYEEFISAVVKDNNELDNEPGEKYSYSNIGYLLLGEVISKVSGMSYREYITENIISKLNLDDGAYLGFEIPDTNKHAYGYIKKWSFLNLALTFMFDKGKYIENTYDGWNQFRYFYIDGTSYGGLIGNAKGFSKYLQALLKDNELISNNSKTKLFTNQTTNDGKILDMCLSWFQGSLNGAEYYAHAGGGGGYYCEIRIYPAKKLASVIMFNRTGVSDERFLDEIDKYFF